MLRAFIPAISNLSGTVHNNLDRTFNFSKGLNIILGSNGSGKTTLLNQIKMSYGIVSGYNALATKELPNLTDPAQCRSILGTACKSIAGAKIQRDPQYMINCDLFYQNTEEAFNALSGLNIFTLSNTYAQNTLSAGEHKMNAQTVLTEYIESNQWRSNNKLNEMITNAVDMIGDASILSPILVFDEPTLSMSPEVERMFFRYMNHWSSSFQIIIATNSPFSFMLSNANYIELENGYMKSQVDSLYDYANQLHRYWKVK